MKAAVKALLLVAADVAGGVAVLAQVAEDALLRMAAPIGAPKGSTADLLGSGGLLAGDPVAASALTPEEEARTHYGTLADAMLSEGWIPWQRGQDHEEIWYWQRGEGISSEAREMLPGEAEALRERGILTSRVECPDSQSGNHSTIGLPRVCVYCDKVVDQ